MHLTRFDRGYSRRKFLRDAGIGVLSTGVLAPLWDVIAATGDIAKAYPEELLSIEAYTKGNRPELAQQEQEEIDIIQSFLPRQMTDAEIEAAVDAAVKDAQASSLKQMGAVMALLRERHAGTMDFAKAGARVKARLG